MRKSNWTPSIVPDGDDHNVYLVMDDLGRLGRSGAKPTTARPSSRPSFSTCSPPTHGQSDAIDPADGDAAKLRAATIRYADVRPPAATAIGGFVRSFSSKGL